MTETQRNFLILAVVALIVVFASDGGALALGSASALLNLLFTLAIVAFVIVMYQRNSGTIATMDLTPRLVMQVCVAGLVVLLATGSPNPFLPWPFGWRVGHATLFWPGLMLCGFGIWWSWQQRTSRW